MKKLVKKIILNETNGFGINLYPSKSDTAIVIMHGASEGALRYTELATKLNEHYNVITYNHPGHETGRVVDFELDELFEASKSVLQYAQSNYERVVVFAHSMGTLVLRNLLIYVKDDTKIILSGAPVLTGFDKFSSHLAMLALKIMGKDKVSEKMNFKVFDEKSSKNGLKDKAWLSSQEEIVMFFKASKLNNQLFTNKALSNLLEISIDGNKGRVYRKLGNFDLMLVSGGTDAFTNNGRNYRYITKYAKSAKVKVYSNSYHEVHNDKDKEQLIKDMIRFIEKDTNGKN